jgi:hypothetical protein
MKKEPTIVTQEEIDSVWGHADFGQMKRFDVIKYGLLKTAGGWYQGHTSTHLLQDLGLIKGIKNGSHKLTFRGQRNLYEFFKDEKKSI